MKQVNWLEKYVSSGLCRIDFTENEGKLVFLSNLMCLIQPKTLQAYEKSLEFSDFTLTAKALPPGNRSISRNDM